MNIYIVRHGQVPHNALKQYNITDEDLTDLGIKQAEELREMIKNTEFDIIISSPLIRAVHTANIININNKEIIFNVLVLLNQQIKQIHILVKKTILNLWKKKN